MDVLKVTTLDQLQRLVANAVEQCPALETRANAAAGILLAGKVHPLGEDRYEVVGCEGKVYLVD
jgi:hypothetical protein